jgi:DNA-binding MarR family transcriptional regulator
VFTLHHLIMRVGDRLAAEIGLTSSRWLLLCAVGDGHPPATVGELSERASLSVQAVSRMLAVMQDEGLVERTTRAGEGRSVFVSLTERGRSALEATGPLAERFEAGLHREMPADQLAALVSGLTALIGNVSAFERELSPCE